MRDSNLVPKQTTTLTSTYLRLLYKLLQGLRSLQSPPISDYDVDEHLEEGTTPAPKPLETTVADMKLCERNIVWEGCKEIH